MQVKNTQLIAFYLPQFHRIPENDRWWGDGFTEWTNVKKALPRFHGHHQPHVPLESNYYDLADSSAMVAQAEMAREYGISGFCFYHYWFNGHKLLERPIEVMLQSGKPDFPFMLCWANENWTRRWDGQDAEVLIAQTYDSYDFDSHARYLASFLLDPRYIKMEEKPALTIYRADYLPKTQDFIQRMRESLSRAGVKDVFLLAMSRSKNIDAHLLRSGFDQIIDFQPDQKNAEQISVFFKLINLIPQYLFGEKSLVFSSFCPQPTFSFRLNYEIFVRNNISKKLLDGHLPCVFPTWDNSARRKHRATIIQNNEPRLFKIWLKSAILKVSGRTMQQTVFVNAWNEWAEGCHLEPDEKNGMQFLHIIREIHKE